ncbi:apolipoprotein D [Anabrus simplex]|uniref:apolipoprotein D n=1 Tax=Anabrus simplex TaxID=316456 RepID=UPI0034DDA54C
MSVTLLVLGALLGLVHGHSYHLGSCPSVEPMPDFQMNRFLGKWYVIQKTSTGSRCLVNNYKVDNETGGYLLEQESEHLLLGLTSVDHIYRYTGKLSVPKANTPAKMVVNFPLSVAGTASYVVFMTDYETYAGVFTCQKLAFAHRQSASILSRKPTLDKQTLDKIRNRLSSYNVDPFDLSIISHKDCPTGEGVNIDINPDTFSPENIAGVVRTAGDKLGDGVEFVAEGAKNLYNRGKKGSGDRDREELSNTNDSNDAEWLP